MKELMPFLWVSMLSCISFSCVKQRSYPEELRLANRLIDIAPDSALRIIKNLSNPSDLRGKARADYALLYTQACDKNQILQTDDSLIQIAVDYYDNYENDLRASQSYFYLGSIYRNGGQDSLSIKAFLKALQKAPQENTDRLQMQIFYNLGERYYVQSLYQDALDMYQNSLKKTILLDDTLLMYSPYFGIAQTFMAMEINDSALVYYQKALDISRFYQDDYRSAIALSGMSSVYFYKKDTLKALELYEQLSPNYNHIYGVYWRSKFLYLKNELDSARLCLEEGLQSASIYTKASCYDLLYKMEKQRKNHAMAYAYIDSFNVCRDSIHALKRHDEIHKLNTNHIIELNAKENEKKDELHNWQMTLVVVSILLGSALFFVFMRKRLKEELLEQERLRFKDQFQHIHGYLKEKFGEDTPLEEAILIFKREIIQKGVDSFNRTTWKLRLMETDKVIKPGDFIKQRQKRLYKVLLVCFSDFRESFFAVYPDLSEDDMFFCIFSALNFRMRLIAYCMNSSTGALRVRKNRMKRYLTEETFQIFFENSQDDD